MDRYDLIVIGAGPGGLMGAISADLQNICVLESNARPEKKLLITGGGQCNVTREGEMKDFLSAFGPHGRFLRNALYGFTNDDLIRFFEEKGCPLVSREDGKIFPFSRQSRDILNVLLNECEKKHVSFYYNSEVLKVLKEGADFICQTPGDRFLSKRILLATGGMSYPLTGSRGKGYELAQALGHEIVPPKPALTPLYVQDFELAPCAGISFERAESSVIRSKKKIQSLTGDLLITHKGFSGPGILHLSRYIEKGDEVWINFLPPFSPPGIEELFLKEKGKKQVKSVLMDQALPRRFVEQLLGMVTIPLDLGVSELSREKRKALALLCTAYRLKNYYVGDFSRAMVTAGGVNLKEINPKTMESRLCPGLYFAGEVMDIDGNTGGYNLQAAFSTAHLGGKSMKP